MESKHEGFQIKTEIISPTRVRLSWEGAGEVEGSRASRFRVLCSSPGSAPVEAVTTAKMIEMDTFTPGAEYTCEVHPVWDNLFEGIEVISANPGTSQPFVMDFKEPEVSTEKVRNEEHEAQTTKGGPNKPQNTSDGSTDLTTVKPEDNIPEVAATPQVQAEATSGGLARVRWEPVGKNGVNASRYRVICQTEDLLHQPIKIASTKQTVVEVGTFEPGLEYTCSVYAIWDNLASGAEVVSIAPGISNAFRMPNRAERRFVRIFTLLYPIAVTLCMQM
ncbi:Fibronectin type III [Echinococcus multilocularis]|uniref:Fibronectin type III n=1 Tax=Echinococcus multilocularis TaxID=6211 RepID=A0A087VXM6_ECHMU|nr:Fibronectin type III [Echinococcus multilocularis]